MRVAYVLGNFPILSQTFIIQEICDHLDSGLDLSVIVLGSEKNASASLASVHPHLTDRTRYLGLPSRRFERVYTLAKMTAADPRALVNGLRVCRGGRFSDVWLAATLSTVKPKYDIIHCHFGNVGQTAAIMRRRGLLSGKLLVTVHGFDISQGKYGFARKYYSDLFEHTDCLLPVSNYWKTKLETLGADPARVIVHRMGVDLDDLKPAVQQGHQGLLRLCSIGRFVEKKGHFHSIRAVAKLKAMRPDLKVSLLFVGDGPLRSQAEALVQALGLSDSVDFRGGLQHASALELLAESDAFILPSVTAADGDMEGVPVSLMEAMALQKPVISTWHSGIPELVEHEKNGLLVPEHDVDALAGAIVLLADNPSLRVRFGLSGRSKVEQSFNARRLGKRLRELYAGFIQKQKAGVHDPLRGPHKGVAAPAATKVVHQRTTQSGYSN